MKINTILGLIVILFVFMHYQLFSQAGSSKPKKYSLQQLVIAHPPDPVTNIKTLNSKNKTNVPVGLASGLGSAYCSFTKTATPEIIHPPSTELFPDDAALSGALNSFLTSIEEDTYFTVYFSKIHLLYLHQLYSYLTRIYSVFNLTTIDSLEQYLSQGQKNCLIKKKLIINHLISIIEAQSNQAVLARFPGGLPKHIATFAGTMLMKNDYGANLDMMLKDSEKTLLVDPSIQELLKPTFEQKRNQYLTFLANYIKFFNLYTKTLSDKNPNQGLVGYNTFVTHAQRIKTIVERASIQINSNLSTTDKLKALQGAQKINPPLFFYDTPSLRALKLIPALAQTIPPDVMSIPWPTALVKAAESGASLKDKFGYESTIPIAYFTNKKGEQVKDQAQAFDLYVNIPTMQYIYTQEILPQPAWMNSYEGILKMLRACVGDFSMIFDPLFLFEDILDPCLGCILNNATVLAGFKGELNNVSCQGCSAYMSGIAKALNAVQISSKEGIIDEDTGTVGSVV